MKIFYSAASPFARKVMVCAAELGLELERLPAAAGPVKRDPAIIAENPLGQVPTLVTDDGTALYDSRVICEFLNHHGEGRLFPTTGKSRWQALVEQALGDGMLGASLLARYETVLRPGEKHWPEWYDGQMDKVRTGLDQLVAWAPEFGARVDIGTITIACALGYLDFRYPDYAWRNGREGLAAWFDKFGARPSMAATKPV